MAVIRASDERRSGLIYPVSKLCAIRHGRCRHRVATQCHTQKNFVTIVTRLGPKAGGKADTMASKAGRRGCLVLGSAAELTTLDADVAQGWTDALKAALAEF